MLCGPAAGRLGLWPWLDFFQVLLVIHVGQNSVYSCLSLKSNHFTYKYNIDPSEF